MLCQAQAKAIMNKALDEVVAATVLLLAKSELTQPYANPKHAEMLVKGALLFPLLLLPLLFCMGLMTSRKPTPERTAASAKPVPSEPAQDVYISKPKPRRDIPAAGPAPKATNRSAAVGGSSLSKTTTSKRVGGLVKTKGTMVSSPSGDRMRMP